MHGRERSSADRVSLSQPVTFLPGTYANDWKTSYTAVRTGRVVTVMLSTTRSGATWNAKAWESSSILKFPDGMRSVQNDRWVPVQTNFSDYVALTIGSTGIDVRPTQNTTFPQGTGRLDSVFSFIIA